MNVALGFGEGRPQRKGSRYRRPPRRSRAARADALLESREVDVALVYRYNLVPKAWPKAVTTHTVIREELLVVRAGDAAEEEPGAVDLGELADETWISTREGTAGAAMLRQLCRPQGFEPTVSYRSNNYSVIQGLVRAGLGIAVVPALGYRPGPGLSVARIGGAAAYREVLVASSPTWPRAVVEGFISSLRRATRALGSHAFGAIQAL